MLLNKFIKSKVVLFTILIAFAAFIEKLDAQNLTDVNNLVLQGKYVQATAVLNNYKKKNNYDFNTFYLESTILVDTGKFQAAENLYDEYVRLWQNYVQSYANYASFLSQNKKWSKAEGILLQAYAKWPDSKIILYELIFLYTETSQFEKARKYIAEAKENGADVVDENKWLKKKVAIQNASDFLNIAILVILIVIVIIVFKLSTVSNRLEKGLLRFLQ